MNIKSFLLALTLAIAPLTVSAAGVYKWTDKDGIVHFGDRQPVGQQSETIDIHTGAPKSGAANQPGPVERVQAMDEQKAQTAEEQKVNAVKEAQRKQREANCKTAKTNLDILSTNGRIKVEENGEQRYLSPEEIDQKRQQFQAIADENCVATSE